MHTHPHTIISKCVQLLSPFKLFPPLDESQPLIPDRVWTKPKRYKIEKIPNHHTHQCNQNGSTDKSRFLFGGLHFVTSGAAWSKQAKCDVTQ